MRRPVTLVMALASVTILGLISFSKLPLAMMGAVIGLTITNTPLSVIAAIGAIMLAGIVVNNGIVLVDRINQLRRQRLELDDAVRQAGRERFRPILMTTATTVLGLLPMAVGNGDKDLLTAGAASGHGVDARRGAGHLHAAHPRIGNPDRGASGVAEAAGRHRPHPGRRRGRALTCGSRVCACAGP
jgi:hypothetical protein